MMNGSQLLEGYIADIDASVVTRVLDEGGRILGKAVCENYSSGGGSFTAVNGLVRNPFNPSRMAAGSSSGCAVLVSSVFLSFCNLFGVNLNKENKNRWIVTSTVLSFLIIIFFFS